MMLAGDIVQIILLGAMEPKKKKKKAELLYAVVVRQKRAKIRNLMNVASFILQNSRVHFFGVLHKLLSLLDKRYCSVDYVDTDSILISSTFPDLASCLRERNPENEESLNGLMEDCDSRVSQHGKLQHEGRFTIALFRSAKSYLLGGEEHDMRRMKGVSRTVQALLTEDYFNQDPEQNAGVVRSRSLRPTRAGQIMMLQETKTMLASFNLKAKADVRSSGEPFFASRHRRVFPGPHAHDHLVLVRQWGKRRSRRWPWNTSRRPPPGERC
jgi:hypothetical protein